MTTYKHASDIDRIHDLEREITALCDSLDNQIVRARIAEEERADAEQAAARYEAICMWLALAAIGLLVAWMRGWWQ